MTAQEQGELSDYPNGIPKLILSAIGQGGPMNPARAKSLNPSWGALTKNFFGGLASLSINKEKLSTDFILEKHRLHPAFNYLSAVHSVPD